MQEYDVRVCTATLAVYVLPQLVPHASPEAVVAKLSSTCRLPQEQLLSALVYYYLDEKRLRRAAEMRKPRTM